MNHRGFTTIVQVLIILGVALLGGIAYLTTQKSVRPVEQNTSSGGVIGTSTIEKGGTGGVQNPNVAQRATPKKISSDVFLAATYELPVIFSKSEVQNAKMQFKDGHAQPEKFTNCSITNYGTGAVAAAAIDLSTMRGVVTVYCNYGASRTDVFFVAFSHLDTVPVQTDAVDLRAHPDLKARNVFRVGVQSMSLSDGILKVVALVVPESLRNAAGVMQSATEPVSINYALNSEQKLFPVVAHISEIPIEYDTGCSATGTCPVPIWARGTDTALSIMVPPQYSKFITLWVQDGNSLLTYADAPRPVTTPAGVVWQEQGAGDAGCSTMRYSREWGASQSVLVSVSMCEGDRIANPGLNTPETNEMLKILDTLAKG